MVLEPAYPGVQQLNLLLVAALQCGHVAGMLALQGAAVLLGLGLAGGRRPRLAHLLHQHLAAGLEPLPLPPQLVLHLLEPLKGLCRERRQKAKWGLRGLSLAVSY